jgi:hypothetical protein
MLYRIPIIDRCKGYYIRWYFNGWHYWMFYPGGQTVDTEGQNYSTKSGQIITIGSGNLTMNQMEALRTLLNSSDIWVLSGSEWRQVNIQSGSQVVYSNNVNGYEMEIVINSSITIDLSNTVETSASETLTDESGSIITNESLEIIYL